MNYNERLSGNEAIAFAMKQIDPDVMAAFPITPSTEIPQYFAQYTARCPPASAQRPPGRGPLRPRPLRAWP